MIRTVEQYLERLNDGRQIWCLGEKVADVRTHPTLSSIIRTAAMDYGGRWISTAGRNIRFTASCYPKTW